MAWAKGPVAVLALLLVNTTVHAGLIEYEITATVTATAGNVSMAGSGIGIGDSIAATFLVDDTTPSSGYPTYAYFDQAVIGGSVAPGGLIWSIGGTNENWLFVISCG